MALDRADRASNGVHVPSWMVKIATPILGAGVALLGWGASMMWDSRELVRELAVTTRYEIAQLRTDVLRASEDRFTGAAARDAFALRDQRIEAIASEQERSRRDRERAERTTTRGR